MLPRRQNLKLFCSLPQPLWSSNYMAGSKKNSVNFKPEQHSTSRQFAWWLGAGNYARRRYLLYQSHWKNNKLGWSANRNALQKSRQHARRAAATSRDESPSNNATSTSPKRTGTSFEATARTPEARDKTETWYSRRRWDEVFSSRKFDARGVAVVGSGSPCDKRRTYQGWIVRFWPRNGRWKLPVSRCGHERFATHVRRELQL